MKFELTNFNRNAPEADLIADVRRVASMLGKTSVSMAEQNEHGRFNAHTLSRRFEGWNNTLKRAGLELRKKYQIPDEELFENIKNIWVSLGRQPFYSDLAKGDESFGGTTYSKRFGSWRKALEAFVSYINAENTSPTLSILATSTKRVNKPSGPRDINWRLRFIVMRRDNFKCTACGRSPATDPTITLDVDHITAWSKGGPTVLENLQTLCTKCNIGKSDLEFTNEPTTEVHNVELK